MNQFIHSAIAHAVALAIALVVATLQAAPTLFGAVLAVQLHGRGHWLATSLIVGGLAVGTLRGLINLTLMAVLPKPKPRVQSLEDFLRDLEKRAAEREARAPRAYPPFGSQPTDKGDHQ